MKINCFVLAGLLFALAFTLSHDIVAAAQPAKRTRSNETAKYKNWSISYSVRGQGDAAIVLIHGWGADSSSWSSQWNSLQFEGRVIAIDLIGHGKSDKPKIDYTLNVLSESVVAVLDHLDVDRAVLMGHSNGVAVCRDVLETYPNRVKAMILVDGPLKSVMPEAMAKAMSKRLGASGYKQLAQQMRAFLHPQGELTQQHIDRVIAAMENTPSHVLQGTFQAQFAPNFYKKSKIKVPVLAVYARNKMWSAWNAEYEQYVRELIPNIEYDCWEASHLVHFEQATRFNRRVQQFIHKINNPTEDSSADVPHFDFRVGFWINLHGFLKACSATESDRRANTGKRLLRDLDSDSRRQVSETVLSYQKKLSGRSEISDPELIELERTLSQLGNDRDVSRLVERFPDWAYDLRNVESIFRRSIWPQAEKRLNRLHQRSQQLINRNQDLLSSTAALFQNRWPTDTVLLDLVIYANWAGAYTTTTPPHIRIAESSEFEDDKALLESIVHESAHLILTPRNCPFSEAIDCAFKKVGAEPPPDLWHAILFFAVGNLVEELAMTNGTDYQPFADRHSLYRRGHWSKIKIALQEHWPSYRNGRQRLDTVLERLAQTLPRKHEGMTQGRQRGTRISPLLLVEDIETCLPFWKNGLGFNDHLTVSGKSSLDFVELRRGDQSIMFQSRAAIEQDRAAPDVKDRPFTKDGTILYVHLDGALDPVLRRLQHHPIVVKRRTMPYGLEEVGLLAPGKILVMLAAAPVDANREQSDQRIRQQQSSINLDRSEDLLASSSVRDAQVDVELAAIELRRAQVRLQQAEEKSKSNLSKLERLQLELAIEVESVKLRSAQAKLEGAKKSVGLNR